MEHGAAHALNPPEPQVRRRRKEQIGRGIWSFWSKRASRVENERFFFSINKVPGNNQNYYLDFIVNAEFPAENYTNCIARHLHMS
jgi:hypothetical protein